jgi:hypothetical protein
VDCFHESIPGVGCFANGFIDIFSGVALQLVADQSEEIVFVCEVVVQGTAGDSGFLYYEFKRSSQIAVFCEVRGSD